jgi:hypothetical protein
MIRKGQLEGLAKRALLAPNGVINQLLGVAASRALAQPLLALQSVFATLPYLQLV